MAATQRDIDEAAERLAEVLKDTDLTTVEATLHKVRAMALPPKTEEEKNAEARVLDARAAQRAVALFRTEALLYSVEAERTDKVADILEQAHLAIEDEVWRHAVIDPVKAHHTQQLEMARQAKETAYEKEREFVRLRRDAHTAVDGLILKGLRRCDHEFRVALSFNNGAGVKAAEHVDKVIAGFEQQSTSRPHPRQPIPESHDSGSPSYLTWLREEAAKAITVNQKDSFLSLVNELAQQCNGVSTVAPLKGYERTVQKTQDKYKGDYSRVLDLIRGMVVFDNIPDLAKALDVLAQFDADGRVCVIRAKDRLSQRYNANQRSGGYRDCLLNLQLGSQLIVELQLHIAAFLKIKNGPGHANYEAARNIHMFNDAFTTRSFLWEPDTPENELEELLTEVREGVLTRLTLDYSTGLWNREAQQRLAEALQNHRCALTYISLRSCRCGDDFLLMCLPEEYIDSRTPENQPVTDTVRLGSLLHEGTAGRISGAGIDPLLRYLNNSLRVLDLEGSLDLDWYENCGDEVVETIVNHVNNSLEQGNQPLPQLQELNLKSTGLTKEGLDQLMVLREEGKLPQLKTVHVDDDLDKSPTRVGHQWRPALKKDTSAFMHSSFVIR